MAIKKIQLRGISRTPSDRLTADGGCAESLNVFLDEDELAPMPVPEDVTSALGLSTSQAGTEVVYIHKTEDYTNYILKDGNDIGYAGWHPSTRVFEVQSVGARGGQSFAVYLDPTDLPVRGDYIHLIGGYYYEVASVYPITGDANHNYAVDYSSAREGSGFESFYTLTSGETLKEITSIGNTLLILTNKHMEYVLYKNGVYTDLGDKIPDAHISVKPVPLEGGNYTRGLKWERSGSAYQPDYEDLSITIEEQELYDKDNEYGIRILSAWKKLKAELLELINRAVSENNSDNALSMSVMVRYAVRLYDGTYVNHSAPILVDPWNFERGNMMTRSGKDIRFSYNATALLPVMRLSDSSSSTELSDMFNPYYLKFSFEDVDDFNEWSDIVSGIEIFMSPEINRFNLNLKEITSGSYYPGGVGESKLWMKSLTDEESVNAIINNSYFYRIKNYDVSDYAAITGDFSFRDITEYSGEKLIAQPRLPDDTAGSNDKLIPGNISVFNNRLLISSATLEHMSGYYCAPSNAEHDTSSSVEYYIEYFIRTSSGSVCKVLRHYSFYSYKILGPWLYYPNPRCFKAIVYRKRGGVNWYIMEVPMTEHPELNGSYFFAGFGERYYWESILRTSVLDTASPLESLSNRIFQSKVDNPFIVESEQKFTGKIIDTAVITKPLSTGQFGYASIYVFTDEGIWAISSTEDGSFGKYNPVSQDVALPGTVCQLDQSVAFTTKRGVMLLTGSDIRCISDKMNGKHYVLANVPSGLSSDSTWSSMYNISHASSITFADFIKDARTLYDYVNQRLILFHDPASGTRQGYAYVYMLRTDTWHKMPMKASYSFKRILNSYPEAYISASYGSSSYMRVLSFSTVADQESTSYSDRVPGIIVTRTLNLDNDDVRKSIRHVFVRGVYASGYVKYFLQGSMDGITWVLITSLHGPSCKFYRIVVLTNLLPSERVTYIEVDYEPRFTDRIR